MHNSTTNSLPFYRRYRYELLLLVLFVTLYLLFLGVRPLMVPDEIRYAEIPREMIVSGDWVSPHIDGMRYFEKPALGYWVHGAAIRLLGENSFAVRLPAPLAVGLSAFLIYFLFRRLRAGSENDGEGESERDESGAWDKRKNDSTGLLAAFIFLVSLEVFGVGNAAVLDNLLALFLTATIIFFFCATEAIPGSGREKLWLLGSGAACGLAFLTKGFLAFAVPVLTLSAYLVWERRYRDLWRMSWLPLLTAILVALPWSILIHLREPDFWNFFFWNEHVRRFLAADAQHKNPFYYFLVNAPGLIMPWTLVTPVAVAGLRQSYRKTGVKGRLIRMALCWLILPFLFFSCASGKLLTYLLPGFPPFAILMAIGLPAGLKKAKWDKFFNRAVLANAILFGLILLGFIVIQLVGYKGSSPYSQHWKALLAVNGVIFALILCHRASQSRVRLQKIVLLGLAPWLLFMSAHFLIPDMSLEEKAPGVILERYRGEIGPDTLVVAEKRTVIPACWYLKRDDVYILGKGGELTYGLTYKAAQSRKLDLPALTKLICEHPGEILLVAKVRSFQSWQDHLPQPVFYDETGPQGFGIWRF